MEIYISSTEWEKLNNNFSKEDIIEAFITEIVDNRSIRIPSDVYSNHTVNKICDNMNSYIEHQLGGSYVGGLGMQMSQRPNSGAVKNKEGVFVEPLWVWSKN